MTKNSGAKQSIDRALMKKKIEWQNNVRTIKCSSVPPNNIYVAAKYYSIWWWKISTFWKHGINKLNGIEQKNENFKFQFFEIQLYYSFHVLRPSFKKSYKQPYIIQPCIIQHINNICRWLSASNLYTLSPKKRSHPYT
jgi:hypothetical protein